MLRRFARRILPEPIRRGVRAARAVWRPPEPSRSTYLAEKGWHGSVLSAQSVDDQGPVPWITYPARMMLDRVVLPVHRVFEYGCGNSSLWWAARVQQVFSVDHDQAWAAAVQARAPANLTVVCRECDSPAPADLEHLADVFLAANPDPPPTEDAFARRLMNGPFVAYALELAKFEKSHFDVVVVDGAARALTAWIALNYVKPSGFILFDNSDRAHYNNAYALLAEHGFKRIDFYGAGPINAGEWCTSIFAREFDWLSVNTLVPASQKSL